MKLIHFVLIFLVPWSLVLIPNITVLVLVFLVVYISIFHEKKRGLLFFSIIFLCVVQLTHIEKEPLIEKSPSNDIEIKNNLAAYPPLPIPIAYWFEQKTITQEVYALTKRGSIVLSPSLYFFSNHPRERSGFREFEKFQYVLLPFFVIGLLSRLRDKAYLQLGLLFSLPFLLLTFYGSRGELGPFAMFPFLAVSIYHGLEFTFTNHKKAFFLFMVIFVFASIQTYAYTIY